MPTETVVWADPQTKLIKKGRSKTGGEVSEFSFTYGDPAIRDVYDLGVPRNAKVIDARPQKDVNELLARLTKRFEAGFGDYVAIVTNQGVDEHGKPIESGGAICLEAKNGKAYVVNRYLVTDVTKAERGRNPKRKYGKIPPGWPTPELEAALASMAEVSPTNFLVSDGVAAWQGSEIEPGSFYAFDLNGARGSQRVEMTTAQSFLPGRIWPTRIGLGAFGADAKLRVITDPAKPGLIALQVDQTYPDFDMKPRRVLKTYWLDPAKDDMPVERTHITYVGTTDREETRSDQKFGVYAKTAEGKWYPPEWTTITTMYQPQETIYRQTERVRIWPGKALEPRWFKRPEGKIITRE
jgi:hypothetical protein